MAAEKTFTLTSSQLCALKDFVICAHSKATIPQLLSDAVPKDVAAALGQHFGTLHMLPAPGLAAPKGKKGKKEENGASSKRKLNADGTERELRLLSSYNLYQQRMQSLEQLRKDLPVWKAVNPDGTKRSMVTYAEVWKAIPQASKVSWLNHVTVTLLCGRVYACVFAKMCNSSSHFHRLLFYCFKHDGML